MPQMVGCLPIFFVEAEVARPGASFRCHSERKVLDCLRGARLGCPEIADWDLILALPNLCLERRPAEEALPHF